MASVTITNKVDEKTNNNASSTNKVDEKKPNKKKNRRKRGNEDSKNQLVQEREERYEKLLYQAKKALYQQAKTAKSFECAKLARKLKLKSSDQLQERLSLFKKFPITTVVGILIFRLGILNLNPNIQEVAKVPIPQEEEEEFVDKLLSQKRLLTVIEEWNDKVTLFRRWYLKRLDIVNGTPGFVGKGVATKKSLRKENSNLLRKENGKFNAESYFVTMGNDGNNNDFAEDDTEVKKNRPGQRARKAKAMAIEARKNGTKLDKSLNWREKKVYNDDYNNDPNYNNTTTNKPKNLDVGKIATMGKEWKEEGNAHPSWGAAAAKKKGIVAFQGTKITFD